MTGGAGPVEALGPAVDAVFDLMVDVRRDLHAHPELSFAEVRTTALVRRHLSGLGLAEAGGGGVGPQATGAVFDLEGGRPGRTVVLRADMDALPVHEAVDLPFRSTVDGAMHACGHDVHTAALLGVAEVLAGRAGDLPGRYRFVFQPAEEALGGASAMLAAGALSGLGADARLVGFHVTSEAPTGMVGLKPGVAMSETSSLRFSVRGTGGHGAMVRGGNVITAVAKVAARMGEVVDGLSFEGVDCVCSAGIVRAGTAPNVVPTEGSVAGTLRTFTPEQRATAIERLEALCRAVGESEGVTVELRRPDHASAVENDPAVTAVVQQVATAAAGESNVLVMPPVAPSDDVSELLQVVPGCYFFVGGAPGDGSGGAHHSDTFALDERSLRTGALTMAASALALAADPDRGATP